MEYLSGNSNEKFRYQPIIIFSEFVMSEKTDYSLKT